MNIISKDIVTIVSGVNDLSELTSADIGTPCLLIVKCSEGAVKGGEDAEKFLAEAPFVSALSADAPDESISALFDMTIPEEGIDEYIEKLFKDKTKKQAAEITACFTAARKGSQKDILDIESRAFYRLMAEKNGGNS